MVPHRKPLKRMALVLGLLLSAQFCCCVIPIRWRVNQINPTPNGEQAAFPAALAKWSEDAAGGARRWVEKATLAAFMQDSAGAEAKNR